MESVVRENGGVPATIGILGGVARVGMNANEIVELASTAEKKSALKVSRRDLGYICGMVSDTHLPRMAGAIVRHRTKLYVQGLAGKPIHGGTTISGTMILSQLAGIKIFGTGGLGKLAPWQANSGHPFLLYSLSSRWCTPWG